MAYNRMQNATDEKKGVFRVKGICFENGESEEVIAEVVAEVFAMDTIAPGLMTANALFRYIGAVDEYVFERMTEMAVGTDFKYCNLLITRWSEHTYNCVRNC